MWDIGRMTLLKHVSASSILLSSNSWKPMVISSLSSKMVPEVMKIRRSVWQTTMVTILLFMINFIICIHLMYVGSSCKCHSKNNFLSLVRVHLTMWSHCLQEFCYMQHTSELQVYEQFLDTLSTATSTTGTAEQGGGLKG